MLDVDLQLVVRSCGEQRLAQTGHVRRRASPYARGNPDDLRTVDFFDVEHVVVIEDAEVDGLAREQRQPLHRWSYLVDEIPSRQRCAHQSEIAQAGTVRR